MNAIAIVGMGCRFAGAPDLHAYWDLLRTGRDAFSPVPPDRWDADVFFDEDPHAADKTGCPRGAFLDDIRSFPALAWGLPPRRVEVMDPQHRLVFETSQQAIGHAGYLPRELPPRTGVFVGTAAAEYHALLASRAVARLLATGHFGAAPADPEPFARAVEHVVPARPYTASGSLGNMNAAMVAQELDLHGPAYTVEAACASALVAVVDAVVLLRAGVIDAALAGGVYVNLLPDHLVAFSRVGAISRAGACRPFDHRADGFLQGEGVGMVLLKRYDDAVRDGDRIWARIDGVGMNNDGRGEGPMAPVQAGQEAVIHAAWDDAGLPVSALGYVETHGTGTVAGDITEFRALREALRARGLDGLAPVPLGSSKANVGHTMSAAGIAGLLRAVLALHHGQIPPMAGFEAPKPELDLEGSPFRIPTRPAPWTRQPRVAAVSSFGFGGTNVHVVLGADPAGAGLQPAWATPGATWSGAGDDPLPQLFTLSAPDPDQLRRLAARTSVALLQDRGATVAGALRATACHPVQPARVGVVARTVSELAERLEAVGRGDIPPESAVGRVQGPPPRLGFLYPGQGAQRVGMLRDLRARFPVVAETLADLDEALVDLLDPRLAHLLYPDEAPTPLAPEEADLRLRDTACCQPAMLACSIALTRLLETLGIRPHVVVGHSLGEITAAAAAGVLSPRDAARFVARRGRLMAELPGDHGAMAAVMTDLDSLRPLLGDGAVVANHNHPHQYVVSGATAAVHDVAERAARAGVKVRLLPVSHGFHSPVVDGLDVAPLVDALPLRNPQVPLASGIVDHPWRDAADARDVLLRHARSPVNFIDALRQTVEAGADLLLEVGAGGPLSAFARGYEPRPRHGIVSLASGDDRDGGASLLHALARLWVEGVEMDLAPLRQPAPVASLPPAVLPRQVYWGLRRDKRFPLDLEPAGAAPRGDVAAAGASVPELRPPEVPAVDVRAVDALPEPAAASAEAVEDVVVEVISTVSAYPRAAVRPSMRLGEDLGFDSLMLNDLVARLGERFPQMGGLPPELLARKPRVQDVVDHLRALPARASAEDDDAPLRAWQPGWRPTPVPHDLPPLRTSTGGLRVLVRDPSGRATAVAERFVRAGAVVRAEVTGPVDLVLDATALADHPSVSDVMAGLHPWPDLAGDVLEALAPLARAGRKPDVLLLRRNDDPWAEALAGAARCLAQEWPGAVVKCVGFDGGLADTEVAEAAWDEWRVADTTPDVRYRAGVRETPALTPVPDDPSPALPGPDDVVLVTGGTSGIGARFARRLLRTGARILLVGLGPLGDEARSVLEEGGDRVAHREVDVTDGRALAAALASSRAGAGPVTFLAHFAGLLADGALESVDPSRGRLAREVKVGGWLQALRACGPSLRTALGIGSWAGRFGNLQQAHYGAANALLSALAEACPSPCRAVVAEFSPWTSSPMVRSLPAAVRASLRADGVDFVGDGPGLDALEAALGRSGAIVHGRDLPATLRSARCPERLSVESHPYLADHALEGVPVLPLAAATDLMARVAGATEPFEVRDLALVRGVTVRQPTGIEATVRGDRARVLLGDEGLVAYRARVASLEADEAPAVPPVPPDLVVPDLALDTFYADITFHGPLLRALTAVEGLGPGHARCRVRTGRIVDWIPSTPRPRFVVDPLALDGAMQLCGYIAWVRWRRAGTPTGIGRLRQWRPFPEGEIRVVVTWDEADADRRDRGDTFTGDLWFLDLEGGLLALAEGVRADLRRVAEDRAAPPPPAPALDPSVTDPACFPEVLALRQRLEGAVALGFRNPYFTVHEGTARDTTRVAGRDLLNFSSYNYLGFSGDLRVIQAVAAAVERYGTSVSASRVASGERPFHGELEAGLAAAQGAEGALLFTAGHATNVNAVGHLLGAEDLVLHDELIHDSILQGIRLSGAARRAFRHNDPEHLDHLLADLRAHYRRVLVTVEGVYSMDGDVCPLDVLLDLKERWGCLLLVDEAHSFGVLGPTGRGVGERFGVDGSRVDLWMGTLSKSLASCGGWIAGRAALIDYFRYTAPGFVYSAGLTPANGQAALTSLQLMAEEPWRVRKLQENAAFFHQELVRRGLDVGPSRGLSGVVPVITGSSEQALRLSERLADQGVNVQPIVYPAVADDAARLRFFLSSTHSRDQLAWTAERVAETLGGIRAGR